jgi:hypothetical protein
MGHFLDFLLYVLLRQYFIHAVAVYYTLIYAMFNRWLYIFGLHSNCLIFASAHVLYRSSFMHIFNLISFCVGGCGGRPMQVVVAGMASRWTVSIPARWFPPLLPHFFGMNHMLHPLFIVPNIVYVELGWISCF